jgi:molybdate transport system permease protein
MDWRPLAISIRVSLTATLIVFAVGIPVAWLFSRLRPGPRSLAHGLISLPIVMPPTVLGYFLLVLLGRLSPIGRLFHSLFGYDLVFTWQGAAVAAAVSSLPLLAVQTSVALAAIDRDILDCARVYGASEPVIFWRISLPMASHGIAAGGALAFARALGDFGATLMVAGSIPGLTQTMPLAIYDAWQNGDNHTVLVFALISVALALAFTLVASLLAARQ